MLRLLALLLAAPADAAPTVHWASEPVEPGAAALLAVVGMSNATKIELRQGGGAWAAVDAIGVTKYGCTVTVPASFANAEFQVRADGGEPFSANVARPWYSFGDSGSFATPGGWVRIVGEAINLGGGSGTPSVLRLEGGSGPAQELVARVDADGSGPPGSKLTRWHAYFDLPASIAQGQYKISIAASKGATFTPLATFIDPATPSLATLNVSAPLQWKSQIFTVNATQPGVGRDATAAVATALAAAAANGGGTVFFPTGQDFIKGPLVVAPGVILKGASRELVSVYFHEDNQTSAPPAYITSSKPGAWGVEGLTFYITAFANDIVRFPPGTNGGFFRHNRIRFNSYFCLEAVTGKGSRGRNTAWPHSVGTAVKLAGQNLFVTDNDIFSSGDVVSTLNNGAAGATYMHIARNRFWNGGTTHWGVSWKQCIYEDNAATGASTTAMGSNYPQYSHNDGSPHIQNIYHHNNSQNMVWGNDREMMTCDGGGGVYFGGATSKGTAVTLSTASHGSQPGGSICVLSGTGTGECRRVVSAAPAPAPTPPSPPGPHTALRARAMAVLQPCSGGSALKLHGQPSVANNWTIEPTASGPQLQAVVLCDPPGHSSSSDTCGAQSYFEPIQFDAPDSWVQQYGTGAFALDAKTGEVTLKKGGGKCFGAATTTSGAPIGMTTCTGAGKKWRYNGATHELQLQTDNDLGPATVEALCLGYGAAPPPGPPPSAGLRSWVVSHAYTVDLDETSHVSITPYIGQIAFNGNYYSDGGEIQFYAQAFGVVAAENRFERTGGLSSWARGYSGVDANLRNSFIDNEVIEGNHVWNYNTNDPALPGGFPYFPGGSKTVEPWFFASLTNEQGMPIDPTKANSPAMAHHGAFNRFITFRGNKVNSNGGVVIRGTSGNTLVTGSVIKNSHVGIHVNYTTTSMFGAEGGGIVVVNNSEPAGVQPNYNPYHKGGGAGAE